MTNNKKKELSLLDYSIAVSQALEEYRDFALAEKQKYADSLKQELRELNQEKNSLTEERIDYIHSELRKEIKTHFYIGALTGDDKTSEMAVSLNNLVLKKLDSVIDNLKRKKLK